MSQILFIDTSPSPTSRSRAGLLVAREAASALGATCELVRAHDFPLVESGAVSPAVERAQELFATADGVCVGGPVYDWAPAPQTLNALLHLLDGDGPRCRPFVFIAGAGSSRSLLAYSSAINMVITEVGATVVGGPILIAGDEFDKTTHELQAEVVQRITDRMHALIAYAGIFRSQVMR